MHVTACLAGQKVEVEVGEECRTLQALKEAIVVALPQLCVEGFDVSVGGRGLDDDEGVVSLSEDVCLDVSANTRGLSVLALREAGREVSEDGLLEAAADGDVAQCTLYLDAGVPIDCVDDMGLTPLHHSCIDGHLETARLLLDRGSTAIDEKDGDGETPLHLSCGGGYLETARLLLDRGTAIDEKDCYGETPFYISCVRGHLEIARLLLDRGCSVDAACRYPPIVLELLSDRVHAPPKERTRTTATPRTQGSEELRTPLIFTANRDGDGGKAFEDKNHLNTDLLSERGHDGRGKMGKQSYCVAF